MVVQSILRWYHQEVRIETAAAARSEGNNPVFLEHIDERNTNECREYRRQNTHTSQVGDTAQSLYQCPLAGRDNAKKTATESSATVADR